MRPYLKKLHYKKRGGGVAKGIGPYLKPQHCKKKKKKKRKTEKNNSNPGLLQGLIDGGEEGGGLSVSEHSACIREVLNS
jgi:hypothetical protein